jgi:iron complex outermembrane receptor protein
LTGSRGNPNLKPYTAQQYDLGVEWYISRVNYLSATFWRKDIQGFPIAPARKTSSGTDFHLDLLQQRRPGPDQRV